VLGDYVDIRAEMDVLAVILNCSQTTQSLQRLQSDADPCRRQRVSGRARARVRYPETPR